MAKTHSSILFNLDRPLDGRRFKKVVADAGYSQTALAESFYGHANLRDIIYEHNEINYHPDRIVPGQKFFITWQVLVLWYWLISP